MTLQQLQTTKSEQLDTLTLFAGDFLARLSALLEKGEDLKTLEELSFLKLHGLQVFSSPSIFSLKTSKGSLTTMGGTPSKQSSNQQPKIEIVGNTKNPNGTRQGTRSIVHSTNGIIGTLTATDYKEPKQIAIQKPGESQGVADLDFRIRKLTPREYWRLQGFPDWAFDKAQEVNSNTQLYKQAGNSVTVNVIEAIAREF